MNDQEKLVLARNLLSSKKYNEAENILLSLISNAKVKNPITENETHYTFSGIMDFLTFQKVFETNKINVVADVFYSDIYFNLGFIKFEIEDYDKAIEYYKKGLEWNPVDVSLMFEIAAAYKRKGQIEKSKDKLLEIHKFIYNPEYLAKLYRELGWYYIEIGEYSLANALYSFSLKYFKTNIAYNELSYIASQEKREAYLSTMDEVEELFSKFNIPMGFDKTLVDFYMYVWDKERVENEKSPEFISLSDALYKITYDKKYIIYKILIDHELEIQFSIPHNWRVLSKEERQKIGFPDNLRCVISSLDRNYVIIDTFGKCNKENFKVYCEKEKNNNKNNGYQVLYEKYDENKFEYQIIYKFKNNIVYENYLLINDYIINISRPIYENTSIEKLTQLIDKSVIKDVINSMKSTIK